jgi:hypothetical protein
MGRTKICTFLTLTILAGTLAGCGKSENYYYSKASAERAANSPAAAETILKAGLLKHPNSKLLGDDLASLYLSQQQWTELRQYLSIYSVQEGDYYYSQLASADFDAHSWKYAFDEYFMAGTIYENNNIRPTTSGPMDRSAFCSDTLFDYYRNAAAAAFNMGNKDGVAQAATELRNILSACPPQATDDIRKITEGINQVSSWEN